MTGGMCEPGATGEGSSIAKPLKRVMRVAVVGAVIVLMPLEQPVRFARVTATAAKRTMRVELIGRAFRCWRTRAALVPPFHRKGSAMVPGRRSLVFLGQWRVRSLEPHV